MNNATLNLIADDLSRDLTGERFGRVFVLGKLRYAIDFRLRGDDYLFVSIDSRALGVFLIKRRLKELVARAEPETAFSSLLRKRLANSVVRTIEKLSGERVIRIRLETTGRAPDGEGHYLVIQLTGRSANLFLTDAEGAVIGSARGTHGKGQEAGDIYSPPRTSSKQNITGQEPFSSSGFESLSEALDAYYSADEEKRLFESRVNSARTALNKKLKKARNLRAKLEKDLEGHGDAEHWKRLGDLLLANINTAKRTADKLIVTDYFENDLPEVEIDVDPVLSIPEAAERFFKKHAKARNAKDEIKIRLGVADEEIESLTEDQTRLEDAIREKDLVAISRASTGGQPAKTKRKGAKKDGHYSGVRRFRSSDGFEILVGKRSKDNDHLTFRMARSLDTWMHAADYPGSHVVIRNPGRKEIPPGTLIEAAQIAAYYSKARSELKAAVHYTLRKFVHKPKRSKPGLVSLASFKTVLVEPGLPRRS